MLCPNCHIETDIKNVNNLGDNVIVSFNDGHTKLYPKIHNVEVIPEVTEFEMISSDKRTPMPFQYDGIKFAENANRPYRCLIGDEMGLGKTVQGIGIIKKHPELLPALIIVKSSIKLQWMVELFRWAGPDYIPQIISDGKIPPVTGFNIYIASYDVLRRFTKKEKVTKKSKWGHEFEVEDKSNPFYSFPFKTIILDEVQSIKSQTSSRTDEVRRICQGKEHVIALSGTAIKNSAAEYYPILNILYPDKFPTFEGFLREWVEVFWNGRFKSYGGIKPERIDAWKEYTSNFIIRRLRKDVAKQMPKINRVFHHVDFESDKLRRMYEAEEAEFIRAMEEDVKGKEPINVIARISVLRHLVGLNKIQPTVELTMDFLMQVDKEPTVIFVHHQDVMQSIHKLLTLQMMEMGMKEPLLFHSGLNQDQRFDVLDKFKNGESRVLVASTLAASEGLNLQFCSNCIIAERQWNPANEEQAESRFIRLGRADDAPDYVNGTYMVASGTIDEYFCEIVEKKRSYMRGALDGIQTTWIEESLMKALVDIVLSKGRNRLHRGF